MEKNTETLGDEERSYDSEDGSRSNISNFLDSQEDVVMSDHEPEEQKFLNQTPGGGTVPILSIDEHARCSMRVLLVEIDQQTGASWQR